MTVERTKLARAAVGLFVALLVVVATLSTPVAATNHNEWGYETYEAFLGSVPTYNAGIVDADIPLGDRLLADQRVTVEVTRGDQLAHFWYTTDDSRRVVDSGYGEHADATIVIRGDYDAIYGIYTADNPVAAFSTAYAQGDITVTGTTLSTWMLATLVALVRPLADVFGLF